MIENAPVSDNPVLVEIWRGEILESVHRGAAVVAGPDGVPVAAWGDVARPILPRSSCKMLQALPLVESGAAEAAGLGPEELALACASHQGTPEHTERVHAWLTRLGLGESDLLCGAHRPNDPAARFALGRAGEWPSQLHNNCSGKHAGFLTLTRHLEADPDYVAIDHPVQHAALEATEAMAGENSAGHATDGCSAPNFALSLRGLATAMARMARPGALGRARADAAGRLVGAMAAHPTLIGGPKSPATRLTAACGGRAVAKTGAEGSFTAVLPEAGLGISVKIDDGAERAAETVIAALLARYGALEDGGETDRAFTDRAVTNWRGIQCGHHRAAAILRP